MPLTRREALVKSGSGLGAISLAYLLGRDGALASSAGASAVASKQTNPLASKSPNFPARATSVISLFMQGGPAQMDSFDPKSELQRLDGKPLPESFKSDDLKLQFMSAAGANLMGSPFAFHKRGASGLEISDLLPHVAERADDLAVIRSCYHESFIHGPALSLMHSATCCWATPASAVGSSRAWVARATTCRLSWS